MSKSRNFSPTRRVALAALVAVGLNLALVGRSRAESPAAEPPARVEWKSLSAEEQKLLSRYGDRWDTYGAASATGGTARHAYEQNELMGMTFDAVTCKLYLMYSKFQGSENASGHVMIHRYSVNAGC